jgi:hypothetical protein
MRARTLALWGLAVAPLGAAASEPSVTVTEVRAPSPPHCLADEQWKDADRTSPINLFDGDVNTSWVLCPDATTEPGYSVEILFAQPVAIDRLDVVLSADAASRSKLKHVDVGLRDSRLSTLYPIHVHPLEVVDGRREQSVSLKGRLDWGSMLVDDMGFADRRRKLGMDVYEVPHPVTIDGLWLIFRDFEPGKPPPALAELRLYRDDKPVPFGGIAEARAAHSKFLEQGLEHILRGRFLVADDRTLAFTPEGVVWSIPRAEWDQGHVTSDGSKTSPVKKVGEYRIHGSRLELTAGKKTEPVRYSIDESPQKVVLGEPFAGTYAVHTAPPKGAETAAPTLAAEPPAPASKSDAPPLVPLP